MFRLDEEHLELQASFKEFAENEIKPLAKEIDETERFPLESVKKMAEMGMMGLPIPEEYGGSGIGLSIVKAIMEAMNQGYGVRNVDGGVEFWFELETKA